MCFIVLGGQNYQHDDSLGPCASSHYIDTFFPPRYDMRLLIDGKFRGIAATVGGFVSIAMFRGGRRQNYRGAQSPRLKFDTEQQSTTTTA